MYTRLNIVEYAEKSAEKVAYADRIRYQAFIEHAEHFAAANGLVVGGAAATRLLLGNLRDPSAPPPVELESFQYDFYSDRVSDSARALGDAMYNLAPHGLGHYVTVISKVSGYHLTVGVDGRDMFTVTALPTHRGVRIADVVIPSQRPAQFAQNPDGSPLQLDCMGPEIQLMSLYIALCNPGKAGSWGSLLATEVSLRALFNKEIRVKIAKAVSRVATGGRTVQHQHLQRDLREKYATGPGRVIIGPVAIAMLGDPSGATSGGKRLQVVTTGALEIEAREIAAIAKQHSTTVQWTTNDPKIPTDPRLRRLTIYIIEGNSRRDPILDVYNAAAHELIPYTVVKPAAATYKIGTPFVLLRFRLADIWTMQVLMQMGVVSAGYAKSILHEMLAEFGTAAGYYERVLKFNDAASHLLPDSTYMGRLEAPDLALKRAARDRGPRYFPPPYLPASRQKGSQV